MSEIKPVYRYKTYKFSNWTCSEDQPSYITEPFKVEALYPSSVYENLLAHYEGALDSIREHQQICNSLKAENEELRKLIEALETLCTHDYESKDDFILRVKEKLKNGDSK